MWCRAAAFLIVVHWLWAPADATETAWKFDNPFCKVVAEMQPLADGSGYAVALGAAEGNEVSAHVTLVTESDAYDLHLEGLPLSISGSGREAGPVIATLTTSDKVKYYFVDSFTLDGGRAVTCPSYIFAMPADAIAHGFAVRIAADHLQPIGTPSCKRIYEPPDFNGDIDFPIGNFGNRRLSSTYDVFIDSAGHSVYESLVTSSGVEGVDDFARGAIQQHQFRAAKFLCTPVVAEIEVRVSYEP